MKANHHTLLISAMLWLSIFLIDSLTACTWIGEAPRVEHSCEVTWAQVSAEVEDALHFILPEG